VPISYSQPTFNLTCNVWRHGVPTTDPPALSPRCNLAWGKRVNVASTGGTGFIGIPLVTMQLLLPKLTDVRGPQCPTGDDTIEVPAGSGRIYTVTFVDDIGKGFLNEHRCAILQQGTGWPEPIP
jgi:hypothetical protein